MGHEMVDGFQQTEKPSCATSEENLGNSCKSSQVSVSETVIAIPKELPNSNNSCKTSSVDTENRWSDSGKNAKVSLEGKSWVVDVARVCRICHLEYEQASKASLMEKEELISLGCGCNGELSVAHSCCAGAWFKLKGNRICEICGETVNNVKGLGNDTFMEEWVESRANGNPPESSDRTQEGCWQGKPFCNFLMACLVIAFVAPWFFRINMF